MALDDLYETFEFLRKRITEHGSYLKEDETRTRQVLIDPLLNALGWDVGDPSAVELEHRIEKEFTGGRIRVADYVLCDGLTPLAVVEAKRLGRDLDDEVAYQALTYANLKSIRWMVVTDGDHWRMLDAFEQGTMEDRCLMEFVISDDDPTYCVHGAIYLWRRGLMAQASQVPDANAACREPVERLDVVPTSADGWIPLDRGLPMDASPSGIRYWDGTSESLKSWRNLYTTLAGRLVAKGIVHRGNVPIGIDPNPRLAINTVAEHMNRRKFRNPADIGNGFWLETGANKFEYVRRSKKLLAELGIEPSSVKIRFDGRSTSA